MSEKIISMRAGRLSNYIISATSVSTALIDTSQPKKSSDPQNTRGVQSGIINKRKKSTTSVFIKSSELLKRFNMLNR